MNKDRVKVCIDGIGGDEVMGGYPSFIDFAFANLRINRVFQAIKNFGNYYNFNNPNYRSFLKIVLSTFYSGFLNKSSLLKEQKLNNSIINIISNLEIKNNFTKINNSLNNDKKLNLKDSQLFDINFNQIKTLYGSGYSWQHN